MSSTPASSADKWWHNFPTTPVSHRAVNPDVWRRRFDSHIDEGLRQMGLHPKEAAKARQFSADLLDAFRSYNSSSEADRRHQFLQQINTVASRAFTYYSALDNPGLEAAISNLRFDLAGLAEVLATEETDPTAREAGCAGS